MTLLAFFRTSARIGVSVMCTGALLLAGAYDVVAQNATQQNSPVTDDLVSEESAPAPETTAPPVADIPLPEPGKPFVLNPAIDYGLPDAPVIPVVPGSTVINPMEAYMLPEEEVVVMPATPERPGIGNGTSNGTINGTLIPLEPPVNGSSILPLTNGTIGMPQQNSTVPLTNGTLPQTNGTLQQTNGTQFLPQTNGTSPQTNGTQSMRILTPADFLVKSPDKPQPATPPKPEPGTTPKKDTQPEKPKQVASSEKPAKKEPAGPEQPKKDEKKPFTPPKRGEDLRIPPEAVKTGDLSFLKGCWRGTRPEYHSKRTINERFCFDERGVGKRTIIDPASAGMCYGSTKAILNKNGVLRVVSEQAACVTGETWGAANMVCEGEGEKTPCSWEFPDVGGTASQSYKIRFVRE